MKSDDFISTTNVNPDEIWPSILDEIAKNTSSISFDVWIKTLEIEDIKENVLVLNTPTKSSKSVLQKKYKSLIIKSANKIYSAISDVEFVVKDDEEVREEVPTEKTPIYVDKEDKGGFSDETAFSFNPKYTFDSFIVGSSNQFAAAAANAVATEPGTTMNPLFIYGGSGLGKTHLLHAIGNYLTEHKPKLNVVYVTTDKFVTDFTSSLQKHTTEKFRETYLKADVFIIDDIQSIIKKVQTQEQFFNIFNDLYQKGKQIIITCDKQPKELNPLEERLRSRLEWGMLADIGVPDVETRIAILNKKAQMERYNVSREVIEYIAEIATSNVRTMEGLLSRTVFYSSLQKEEIVTIESAREALKDIAKEDSEAVDATKIVDMVCKFYNVKKEDLLGRIRTKNIAEARQIAMYLIAEYINIPLDSIGNIFGKNHATVIYAKSKIAGDMKKSKKLEVEITDLKKMIEGK